VGKTWGAGSSMWYSEFARFILDEHPSRINLGFQKNLFLVPEFHLGMTFCNDEEPEWVQ
jgi:hypothetical protein